MPGQPDSQIYLLVRRQNPMRLLRQAAHLAQSDVAQQAGVSEQYVRREEHGLVNTLSPRTTNSLAQVLPTRVASIAQESILELEHLTLTEYGVSPTQELVDLVRAAQVGSPPTLALAILIDKWYAFWVRCLRNVLAQKIYTHQIDTAMHKFLEAFTPATDKNPFRQWREGLATRVGRAVFTDILDPTSMLGFCRLVAIHPYTVTQYERGARENMDAVLTKALLDIGIPLSDIETLDQMQQEWRAGGRK